MTDILMEEVEGEPFDLTPDPRIYPMLGEISLHQWRCLAELVDNAVDGFLSASRRREPVESPEVHLQVPMRDDPAARLSALDNGPGMDAETLERAVRAGWTSNDPVSSLGMFGMGFNIATARLGTVTQVWTTRRQDAEWYGLQIDFDQLIRQRHFLTPKLRRPKNDPDEHGTEVVIRKLKPDQRLWFARSGNRRLLETELGRAYSAMLRPNGTPIPFRLVLNGKPVQGRQPCIWGGEGNPSRTVQTARFGTIDVYQTINASAASRRYCLNCWQWLGPGDESCPSCGRTDRVIERERRVHGWVGLQRYLDANHFGIDFLRNGRKIEVENKDLFAWTNDDGSQESEYPIDDPRHRGRLVGEIHIDHCRVNYMKDHFERTDPAWDEMIRVVRGEGPLRPDRASDLGYGQNISPLFLLFQAFRRSSPKPKIAGAYERLLVVPDNDRAKDMADKFYAGEPAYQTDEKWWELVKAADEALLTPSPTPTPTPPASGGTGDASPTPDPFDDTTPTGTAPPPPQPVRAPLPSLSQEYRDDITGTRWSVNAYQVAPTDPDLAGSSTPWTLKLSPGGADFLVNTNHVVFESTTMTPLDGLLAQLAWQAMDFQRAHASVATFGCVLAGLRDRYGTINKLDPVSLSNEARLTLQSMARGLVRNVTPEDSRLLFDSLSPNEKEATQQRMASRSVADPLSAISNGTFLEYAPYGTLLRFFRNHPELFLDGSYWEDSYATLDYGSIAATELARAQVVEYYSGLLADAVWLAEQDPADLTETTRARLMRAALANELLSPAQDDGSA